MHQIEANYHVTRTCHPHIVSKRIVSGRVRASPLSDIVTLLLKMTRTLWDLMNDRQKYHIISVLFSKNTGGTSIRSVLKLDTFSPS